jgi:hypothetical protein
MSKHLLLTIVLMTGCVSSFAIARRHGILVGEILRLDEGARTAVVKAEDGTEHTVHFLKRTSVHGAQAGAAGAKDVFSGLKQGSQVAVHYTAQGTEETAEEVDNIGKDGLKATEATVTHINRGAKTMAVKTADGTEETYRMSGSAARDAGKDITEGSEKSARVTVYYTEDAGHKVAHFFKRAI